MTSEEPPTSKLPTAEPKRSEEAKDDVSGGSKRDDAISAVREGAVEAFEEAVCSVRKQHAPQKGNVAERPLSEADFVGVDKLFWKIYTSQPVRALLLAQGALDRLRTESAGATWTKQMTGWFFNDAGEACRVVGNLRQALEYYEASLSIDRATGDQHGQAATLNNLGIVYEALGELPRAIELYEQSLAIKRETNNRPGQAGTLNNLGNVYQALGELPRAIELYEQSLAIKRETNNRPGQADTLNNLGEAYRLLGELPRAIE
eukprot:scaffold4629_cov138-Pinguiococcus_pyrenoidosus.AAC.2